MKYFCKKCNKCIDRYLLRPAQITDKRTGKTIEGWAHSASTVVKILNRGMSSVETVWHIVEEQP